jgi:hypothetical protein
VFGVRADAGGGGEVIEDIDRMRASLRLIASLVGGADEELADELADRQVICEDLIQNVRLVFAALEVKLS